MPKEKIITSDDILGKEAIDPEGLTLGIVIKLHIDNNTKQISGITIDQGFMKPDLFVGIKYVKHFGIDAILLNKIPPDRFKGLQVLTFNGMKVGIVKEVKLKRTNIKDFIIVKKDVPFAQKYSIPASDVKEIGVSVVCKKGCKMKELEKI